jgi:hypothetical protein
MTVMEDMKRNIRRIDREFIKTVRTEMVNCNILEVETGTNGYHGGDSGHGGRALLRLSDAASTDMRCLISGEIAGYSQTYEVYFSHVDSVEIVVGGDAEIGTLIDSLEFVVKNLKEQIKTNGEWPKYIQ